MKWWHFALVAGAIVLMRRDSMKYFKPVEFGGWYPQLASELKKKLDKFRELTGEPVMISPVVGAVGRHAGPDNQSAHNIDYWGEVLAVDIFPKINGLFITTLEQLEIAYKAARDAGFTGIGLYTDTKPGFMLHVDVRPTRTSDDPALWSRIDGVFLALDEAFA